MGRATLKITLGVLLAGALAMGVGCAPEKTPPEASISWLAPQTRAAQSIDCAIPMLTGFPNTDYQQIAVVEVTDDYSADNHEVYNLLRRKGCETGADALVILEDQHQEQGKPLPGYSADEGKDVGPESGVNVSAREHLPGVGEEGHKGRVLNAAAIIYKDKDAAAAPAQATR